MATDIEDEGLRAMLPPRAWFDDWPTGAASADAPRAALWAAGLVTEVRRQLQASDESVVEFAGRAGVSPSTIRDVLDGTRWPSIHTVHAIILALQDSR